MSQHPFSSGAWKQPTVWSNDGCFEECVVETASVELETSVTSPLMMQAVRNMPTITANRACAHYNSDAIQGLQSHVSEVFGVNTYA